MSVEVLESIKRQSANLTAQEKSVLAEFLLEQNGKEISQKSISDETKCRQLEWLKTNREKYAGQYVALDGERLVGNGATLKEAAEQSRQNGSENPFIIRVFSEEKSFLQVYNPNAFSTFF